MELPVFILTNYPIIHSLSLDIHGTSVFMSIPKWMYSKKIITDVPFRSVHTAFILNPRSNNFMSKRYYYYNPFVLISTIDIDSARAIAECLSGGKVSNVF